MITRLPAFFDNFLALPMPLMVLCLLVYWGALAYAVHRFLVPWIAGRKGQKLGHMEAEVPAQIGLAFGLLISFSISTPIGITIGILVTDSPTLVSIILMSISSGTFIYVSCTEILQHEFERGLNQLWQFTSVCLGGAMIIGLWFVEGLSE